MPLLLKEQRKSFHSVLRVLLVLCHLVWGIFSASILSVTERKKSASYIFPDYSQTLAPLLNFFFQAINLSPGDVFLFLILNGDSQNVDVLTKQFNFCVFDVFLG